MSRSSVASVLRIHSVRDVNNITDLITAFQVMTQLNINTDGVNDLNEALARIRLNFDRPVAEQIYNQRDRALQEAVKADRSNRQYLRQLYDQALAYIRSLPQYFQEDLRHVFPDALATLETNMHLLQRNECVIVVAGEKGAGKSSLVNLIAGHKIFPADMLNGTKTICELRHSESKKFVLYSRQRDVNPKVVECRNEADSTRFLQELAKHVTCVDRATEKSPYDKIDVHWPLSILGEGVVLVDSPGVGESRSVSQQLEDYMSRAFGFIYVINVSNAGGIHKDRLGQLLRKAVENTDQMFDPSTALFAVNWWDQVVEGHEEALQGVVNRLARVWPGVRREQVFPISSAESLQAVERGYVLDEHRRLVKGIRHVLPTTFNIKLTGYYRWLSALLKRSLYSLKISSNIGHKEMVEKEAAFRNVRNQIEALERDAGMQIGIMKDGFRREVDNVTRKLIQFIRSDEFKQQMARWGQGDCPGPDKDSKKVMKEAASRFSERLAAVLDVWEGQSNNVSRMKSNILKSFQRDLELFEDQIKKIEGVLFQGLDNFIITDLQNSMRHHMPVKNVWKRAKKEKGGATADQGCFSLGHAISGCKALDLKRGEVKNVFKNYRGPTSMAEASAVFIQQFKDEDLAMAVRKFFERIAKRFDAASRLLPEFLKADKALMNTLRSDVDGEQDRLASLFPKLLHTCTQLQGSLDMFYVQRLLFFDFSMSDLKYDPSKEIGRGSFAVVYRSALSTGETVALKIQHQNLSINNVTDVLLEDATLRSINHENIIRYYGAARERKGEDIRWVMVLEHCKRTLKQRFTSPEANVPGKQEIASLQMDAMREVALFASQICSALCYMHNKGVVHRDLKSENILLTENDVVKLTDVGLAKRAIDISGTLAGTPAYMAPEVLLQTGQYDMKADIYSLAIITWELWYGQDAADHIQLHLFGNLQVAIKAGLRPSLTLANKPPEDWVRMMKRGWEFEAAKRPPIQDMVDFFEYFLHTHKA